MRRNGARYGQQVEGVLNFHPDPSHSISGITNRPFRSEISLQIRPPVDALLQMLGLRSSNRFPQQLHPQHFFPKFQYIPPGRRNAARVGRFSRAGPRVGATRLAESEGCHSQGPGTQVHTGGILRSRLGKRGRHGEGGIGHLIEHLDASLFCGKSDRRARGREFSAVIGFRILQFFYAHFTVFTDTVLDR